MLVEFSGIPLKVCTQKPRANWVVDVGYEAQMEEARHSLLKSVHLGNQDLLLYHKIKDHFPVNKNDF